MGRKKKKVNIMPALFSSSSSKKRAETWQWASSCHHPRTLSFRAAGGMDEDGNRTFKVLNSVLFDPGMGGCRLGLCDNSPDQASWFTSTSESASHSTESEDPAADESLEVLIRGARSDRLFFEPGGDTSSIFGHGTSVGDLLPPFKESVVLAMESKNPYVDFRRSMEEMVESSGVKDWDSLEELLAWYLRMNGTKNHIYILEAFIDLLLMNFRSSGSSNSNNSSSRITTYEEAEENLTSFSSAASSFSDDDPSDLLLKVGADQ
ncbi:hypothetical protein SAY86_031140 [Trapa natans]|uniref:Transcription repressor n=1 Tax=Trapa natans TaxID=22666 RepID=A0AAN7RB91_TRANT|nr:hypothetical protein SAY86_031140 [Trapa natans]